MIHGSVGRNRAKELVRWVQRLNGYFAVSYCSMDIRHVGNCSKNMSQV